ncbi:MAG: trypsin-like serine peptidase [Oligoflexus sp.]|jgi:V8-like Glu-specific endopeptidase
MKTKHIFLVTLLTGWTVISACGAASETDSEVKSICGRTEDFVPINAYSGRTEWVQTREESVGRLNRNCSGTYIGDIGSRRHLFLTAGHCGRTGQAASVEFNYEENADGPVVTVNGRFIESRSNPDYALIELEQDPGVSPTPLATEVSSNLTIIQHPAARLKVVAFGLRSGSATGSRIAYSGLDTLGGSSGSGILNERGELVGVHTLGGCSSSGGSNSGWSLRGIIQASPLL